MTPRAYLGAVGDVNDPLTWSGTPYHFLQAAKATGVLDEGLPLFAEGWAWKLHRYLWNGWQIALGRGRGGYQYSVGFLEKLWRPYVPRLRDHKVVNCFQLYPPSLVTDQRIRKFFYIDMTLTQLFDFYKQRSTVGQRIAQESVAREREGYHAAEMVVCHSRWAADSVIRDYGISWDKVCAIVPGANIDRDAYLAWCQRAMEPPRDPEQPLRLIFIGKYWDRKGLDRLLEALILARQQGAAVQLTVMGCPRETLPVHLRDVPNVHWLGFVDKRRDTPRFLQVVSQADVGCLLSRAEAGGMALREYHALGLIVMGPNVGGAPEHMIESCSQGFEPSATASDIAGWLVRLHRDPVEFHRLRARAWSSRHLALWDHSVEQWRHLSLATEAP